MTFFQKTTLGVSHRNQCAETAVHPGVAGQGREPRIPFLRQVIVAILARQHEVGAGVVERPAGLQIDRCAQRALFRLGRGGLAHRDAVEKLGRKDVEIESAITVGAARTVGARRRALALDAVDAHARELRAQAAHGDLTAFAGVACDGDARHPLNRLRQVGVGEVGHVLGLDDIDHAIGPTLGRQGATQ